MRLFIEALESALLVTIVVVVDDTRVAKWAMLGGVGTVDSRLIDRLIGAEVG